MSFQGYYGIVVDTIYYHLQNFPSNKITMMIYNQGTDTLSSSANPLNASTYSNPSNESLWGMALDNTENIIYFVLEKVSDSLYYLVSYNISGDSFTVLGEFNVALMLNRNVFSSTPPFTLEKGFHLTENKVYQIPSTFTGKLNFISQNIPSTDTIKAITDHFVFTSS